MKFFVPFAKVDAEQKMVWGYASTGARDDQGEIIQLSALAAALPDYMKFGNIREMHQLSAVGVAKEAGMDDKGLYLGAKIVDPLAWEKVKEGVYKGFSIGGRVTQRDPSDYKTITGLSLSEISTVDRPANPEATFDVWKAAGAVPIAKSAEPFNPPVQIWDCGDSSHKHLAKAEAVKCQEKRAATVSENVEAGAAAAQAELDAALAAIESGTVHPQETVIPPAVKEIDAAIAASKAFVAEARADLAEQVNSLVVDLLGGASIEHPADAVMLALSIEPTKSAPVLDDETEKKGDKPYGDVKYADPGYQADGKARYPIDDEEHIRAAWSYINKPKNAGKYSSEHLASIKSRIIAAWKDKIDPAGPPSAKKTSDPAVMKSLWDIGDLAMMVAALMNLEERLKLEASMEGDESSLPAKAHAACAVLCQLLRDSVAEETAEALDGTEIDEPVGLSVKALQDIAEAILKSIPDTIQAEALVETLTKAGARHNATDQAYLDTAAYAMHRAMGIGTAKRADMINMGNARKAVLDAGATDVGADGREMLTNSNPVQGAGAATQHSTTDTGHNAENSPPNPTGAVPAGVQWPGNVKPGTQKASDPIAFIDAMVKAGRDHTALCDAAHRMLHAASDGATCKDGVPPPTRHSVDQMVSMHQSHDYLMRVGGVQCNGGTPKPAEAGADATKGATADPVVPAKPEPVETVKAAVVEPAADVLAKAVDDKLAPMRELLGSIAKGLETVGARVEQIANTPLPPTVMARVPEKPATGVAMAKMSNDDVAAVLAAMSPEEQTKLLIKASHANPITIRGITDGPVPVQPRT